MEETMANDAMTAAATPRTEADRLRAIRLIAFASLVGTTIEWYDFILYTSLAGLIFNKLFFPASDPEVSLALAYATFAVGFVTRPIGGPSSVISVTGSGASRCWC
jgi:hypothetical protein